MFLSSLVFSEPITMTKVHMKMIAMSTIIVFY